MVILGLGSNLGDRLQNLRLAYQALMKVPGLSVLQASPVYLSDALMLEDSPSDWNLPYLNMALRCETTLLPLDLLQKTREIEFALGRVPGQDWAPRPVDIDILSFQDLVQFDENLHVPHEHLHSRPFALWPFADVAPRWIYPLQNAYHGKTAMEIATQWGSRFSGEAPLHCRQIPHRIDTSRLVGIINVSPDAFSDGGLFCDSAKALAQAKQLVANGAEILDIGAESTNPQATALSAESEWSRLEPVLNEILAHKNTFLIPPKISIDTRHALVAQKALALGVDWINDVSGLSDPFMREIIQGSNCDVVIMHQLSLPVAAKHFLLPHVNPVEIVYDWAEKQVLVLENIGISRNRLIVDVGIGFGKSAEHSLELIQHIETFQTLQTRLLVGHSRKSFLTLFTDKPAQERDIETLPISLSLSERKIDYLRIHNVDYCARSLKVAMQLQK